MLALLKNHASHAGSDDPLQGDGINGEDNMQDAQTPLGSDDDDDQEYEFAATPSATDFFDRAMVGGASAFGQVRRGAASAFGQERRASSRATPPAHRMIGAHEIDKGRNTQSPNPKLEPAPPPADAQSARQHVKWAGAQVKPWLQSRR